MPRKSNEVVELNTEVTNATEIVESTEILATEPETEATDLSQVNLVIEQPGTDATEVDLYVGLDNLDELNAKKAEQELENKRQFMQLVLDFEAGKTRHESEVLGILHWNNCTVEQLHEKAMEVRARRLKLQEIEDLQAKQAGLEAAVKVRDEHEKTFRDAEKYYNEHVIRLQWEVDFLRMIPNKVAAMRRELRVTSNPEASRAFSDAEKALRDNREAFRKATETLEMTLKCVEQLKLNLVEFERIKRDDLVESTQHRLELFGKQVAREEAAVAQLTADYDAGIIHRENCLRECLSAVAI